MKSSIFFKSLSLALLLLFISSVGFSQNRAWNGSQGSDWQDPLNWNGGGVPLPGMQVTITTLGTPPVLIGAGFADKLIIQPGALLTIEEGATLMIDGMNTTPQPLADIGGTLNNNGRIDVLQSINLGISISTTGVVNNFMTGEIHIETTDNDPLRNGGYLQNDGKIIIDASHAASQPQADGPHGILNSNNATLSNFGFISILGGSASPNGTSLRNSGTILNNYCGFITIDGLLRNAAGATGAFQNNGVIHSSFTGTNVNLNANGFINDGILANTTGIHVSSSAFFGGNDVSGTGDYTTTPDVFGPCISMDDVTFENTPCDCSEEGIEFDINDLSNTLFPHVLIIENVPVVVPCVPVFTENTTDDVLDENGDPIVDDGSVLFEEVVLGTYRLTYYVKPDVTATFKYTIGGTTFEGSSEQCVVDQACLDAAGVVIPTLGQWGIMILGLILMIFSVTSIRSRSVFKEALI